MGAPEQVLREKKVALPNPRATASSSELEANWPKRIESPTLLGTKWILHTPWNLPLSLDVRAPLAIAAAVEQALKEFGKIDILINCESLLSMTGGF